LNMSKIGTLTDIAAILSAATAINSNYNTIEAAFDNTLSRDGSAPNQMNADLDLNSNDLLNVRNINVQGLTIGGSPILTESSATLLLAPFASRALAQSANIDTSVVSIGVVSGTHIVEYKRDPAGTALITADGGTWSPIGNVRPEHWGATGDGVADDKAAFDALEAFGKQAWLSGTYRLSAHPEPRNITYVLETSASVSVDGSKWFPRMFSETGPTVRGDHINYATNDPSPVIVGAEYVELPNSHIWRGELVNWWGAQHADVNDNTKGRTAVEAMRINMQHRGEGDAYAMSLNGIALRHPRFAEITSVKGQNNIGMGGGQMNAGTDQVTLYGWGDVVLHDQGFDNVALRGHVILLHANGADTLGYTVDRFGYMIDSRGANDIAGGFIARGNMRAAIDTTGATLSGGASLVTKAGQAVYFDASGATTQTGYVAPVLGTYSIGKDAALPQLDITANGSTLRLLDNHAELRPSVANNEALQVHEAAGGARYAALAQSGSITQLTARDPGAGSTIMALRTTQAGVVNDRLTIDGLGNVNLPAASATVGLRAAGTKVVGVQQAAIPDAIGGTEIATINSILAALRAHGLIAT